VTLLAIVGAWAALAGLSFAIRGVSARQRPSRLETVLARSGRHLLIPVAARAQPNPVPVSPAVIARGRAHFADHCATCHGNDGKGRTMYGRGMSPRAPDMTADATQSLSDGELFWIIENGVKMTGMPGFGDDDPSNDDESWELVDFIRTLPRITREELVEMQRLNPTLSRADVERERAEEEFLAGGAVAEQPHRH